MISSMKTGQFLKWISEQNKRRPGTHVLEPGLGDSEFTAWKRKHPGLVLPPDFLELLRPANGFRLRPTKDTPTGSVRLLPLREIDLAPLVMYGEPDVDGAFPKSWLAIGRDADDSIFAVLDAAKG